MSNVDMTDTGLRLPTTFAVIFGSFNLGFYVAIQGPTLQDLNDLLHINNDTMSYSLAFASLAYSLGGILSGLVFNYVTRPILIAIFFICFAIANIITPFITNFTVFFVITVLKMMCAGGTDAGANVWILEMWPGRDEWLQSLHFLFAVGCALGPLVVEPFLSPEYNLQNSNGNGQELSGISGQPSATATIGDTPNESKIWIPFGLSGLLTLSAAFAILYLHYLSQRRLAQRANKRRLKELAARGESPLLVAGDLSHPAALEAAQASAEGHPEGIQLTEIVEHGGEQDDRDKGDHAHRVNGDDATETAVADGQQQASKCLTPLAGSASFVAPAQPTPSSEPAVAADGLHDKTGPQQTDPSHAPVATAQDDQSLQPADSALEQSPDATPPKQPPPPPQQRQKITSKMADDRVGRPPCYVIFAVVLTAMSLSSYCGIEITSMNYLATFAMHINLGVNKSTAAFMSSALTISFAVGRGIGIPLAAVMKPHKLFYVCCFVMVVGNVGMLVFVSQSSDTLYLWISICIFGVGCGPMFPAIVSFYDYKISRVTNIVGGIFILGSMCNVALNSLIIGHHIIDNALILIFCNLVGSVLLLLLFGTLHLLAKVKTHQRVQKHKKRQSDLLYRLEAAPSAEAN